MAGYADDFSMSNNAIDAYDRGLRPRSKWGKADILDALMLGMIRTDVPLRQCRVLQDACLCIHKGVYADLYGDIYRPGQ